MARLSRIAPEDRPGKRFLAARGSLVNQITASEQFELSEEEIDQLLDTA